MGWDVSELLPLSDILFILQMIWIWKATVENRITRRKPVPVLLCPPQIPHELARARTWASAERSRRQTVWAMARPIVATKVIRLTDALEFIKTSCKNGTYQDTRFHAHCRLGKRPRIPYDRHIKCENDRLMTCKDGSQTNRLCHWILRQSPGSAFSKWKPPRPPEAMKLSWRG
jgi:hypothetical protein